jgi:hypothetical protein
MKFEEFYKLNYDEVKNNLNIEEKKLISLIIFMKFFDYNYLPSIIVKTEEQKVQKKKGRPLGSKNKPKPI